VNRLTKQEQLVLCTVVSLLLIGWAVKAYRIAHPSTGSKWSDGRQASSETAKP